MPEFHHAVRGGVAGPRSSLDSRRSGWLSPRLSVITARQAADHFTINPSHGPRKQSFQQNSRPEKEQETRSLEALGTT